MRKKFLNRLGNRKYTSRNSGRKARRKIGELKSMGRGYVSTIVAEASGSIHSEGVYRARKKADREVRLSSR